MKTKNATVYPEDEDLLALSLATNPTSTILQQQPILSPVRIPIRPESQDGVSTSPSNVSSSSRSRSRTPRGHRFSRQSVSVSLKSETIHPPYPWATNRRATVHTLNYLLSNGLNTISGEVQCKKCNEKYDIEYDLKEKFMEVASFISKNKDTLYHRAPPVWMNPSFPDCKFCDQNNCVKPVLLKKKSINWLFLLLGQMLGCCKLTHLKYFCKHTKNHRTGAKDRVLYSTYLSLCKQLDPEGPLI